MNNDKLKQNFLATQQANTALALGSLLNGGWQSIGGAWTARGGSYPSFRYILANQLMLVQGSMSTTSAANGATVLAAGGMPYYNTHTTQSMPAIQYSGTATTFANQLHLEFNTDGSVKLWGINATGSMGIMFSDFIYLI